MSVDSIHDIFIHAGRNTVVMRVGGNSSEESEMLCIPAAERNGVRIVCEQTQSMLIVPEL